MGGQLKRDSLPALGSPAAGVLRRWWAPLGLIALSAVMLLLDYDARPMQIWDESRNANNAIELLSQHNWLVPHYGGLPDHWNTKPPLLVWLIALLLRAGAPPLLALRLPSMVAAMATVAAVYGYYRVRLRDEIGGLFSGLVLLGCLRFVGPHAGRSGDFDALLVLFITSYVLAFHAYLESTGKARRLAVIALFAGMTLALMTKGIAGGLAFPGLVLYAVWRRRFLSTLSDKSIWIGFAGFLTVVAAYYLVREAADPGYLKAVLWEEVFGRYFHVIVADSPGDPIGVFYFFLVAYSPWTFLLVLALLPTARPSNLEERSLIWLCLIVALSILLVIARSKTVLQWYLEPIFPFVALPVGSALSAIFSRGAAQSRRQWALNSGILLLLLGMPLQVFFDEHIRPVQIMHGDENSKLRYGSLIAEVMEEKRRSPLLLVDSGYNHPFEAVTYNAVADFYAKVAEQHGIEVKVVPPGVELAAGTFVGTCDPQSRNWLEQTRAMQVTFTNQWCALGRIGKG
ncbi:MAG TPA: glycosyltransferase family 39 protein [Alphaproteobacteria bacterium]|nr:glycosyltransferase family 39 protein [Alphaproteobacteria bacterium]